MKKTELKRFRAVLEEKKRNETPSFAVRARRWTRI
jgi:hypothetical protein